MNNTTDAVEALATCSLPPHKIVKERVLGSLNGVYYRLVHKDTGNPIVLGIIGETRELARANTLEAIRAENDRAVTPGEKGNANE